VHENPEIVEEESRLLKTVLTNLRRLRHRGAQTDHTKTLMGLRDSLSDEKLPEDIASILETMDRTAALMAHQSQSQRGKVNVNRPYFGHMILQDDFGTRSILIGTETFISDRVRIVDWRNAPISRLFYQYSQGDEYEERINENDVVGEVVARRTVGIQEGQLSRVADDKKTWIKGADGSWLDCREMEAKLAGGAGVAIRPSSLGTNLASGQDKHLKEITSLLDPEQFKLITHPESGVVVIQGTAGSGKTTVALHRIAYLNFLDKEAFRPQRMLVVAFSKALVAYISQVLPALGVKGVRVSSFEGWISWLRRMHFPRIPEVHSSDTPAIVIRLKTHPAMLQMLDDAASRHPHAHPAQLFEELFTDRTWLSNGVSRWAEGEFSSEEIRKVHRWCTEQHYIREDGTGAQGDEKPTIDQEDDAILLRLHQNLWGPLRLLRGKQKRGPVLKYDHIMVDEAQDLSSVELAVILDTANQRRSITMAGDTAQSIATHRKEADWSAVLPSLGLNHVEISPLEVSYRSTRQIMEVAHHILGPLAPEEPVSTTREGAPVAHLDFSNMGEAVAWLGEALFDLSTREPTASVALLTVNEVWAAQWFAALDRAEVPNLAHVTLQEFSFAPGIEITDIRSTKGLEFDYVILLGANEDAFPDTRQSRHLLFVGATRAAHQLWFVSTGNPSSLIPQELSGLIP
jgi:DNA helicase-2/ATP-dependent DNA helicase PcrA